MTITSDIKLTAEQERSVNYSAGDLLVRGVAGSGKSVVLMKRALHLNQKANEKHEKVRILIMTYTKVLVEYTRQLVNLTAVSPCLIELSNIDSVVWQCCRAMGKSFGSVASEKDLKKCAALALNKHLEKSRNKKHRFYDVDPQFWADEFAWMAQKDLNTKQAYVDAERIGRGTKVRITKDDKPMVFEFYELFKEIRKTNKAAIWEDYYQYAWDNKGKIPDSFHYDYVLIDEAQDLSFVQLRFARFITGKAITIAADAAQKIYNKSFAWKDIGIDIRGQASKSLSVTFRNTKEIWAFAECLQNVNRYTSDDSNSYTESEPPEFTGLKPRVYSCKSAVDENYFISALSKKLAAGGKTVGILFRSYSEGIAIKSALNSNSVPFSFYKDKDINLVSPGVKVCTLHSSKGIEFDAVIIPYFNSAVFPPSGTEYSNPDSESPNEALRLERSLLYVGATRAKNELILTFCGSPSPFLAEFEHLTYDYLSSAGKVLQKPNFAGITKQKLLSKPKSKPKENTLSDKLNSYTIQNSSSALKPSANLKTSAVYTESKKKLVFTGWRPPTEDKLVIGARVKHRDNGEGIITRKDGGFLRAKTITVLFDSGSEMTYKISDLIASNALEVSAYGVKK